MSKFKKIPKFRNEQEELEFWSKHDATEYVDFSKGKKMSFPKLKPSVKSISLRLPESLVIYLKILANKMDVPYQSLMKVFLIERVKKELRLTKM